MTVDALGDIIRSGTNRGLDFVTVDELRKRTGVGPDSVLKFALSEMLCNALDKADASEISVDIQVEGDLCQIQVGDNGSKKLSLKEIKLILDFDLKASSKRGLLRVSRGYLGNALKSIFGYSYALAESRKLATLDVVIKSAKREYTITLRPDRINGITKSEIITAKREDDGFTKFIVKFPKDDLLLPASNLLLRDLIFATSMVNSTRRITYNLPDLGRGSLGSAEGGKPLEQETSVLWYTQKQFESLFEDFIRARPETQLKEFIPLFRGFTSKKIIGEILQVFNSTNNHDSANTFLQFFPATPIKAVPRERVTELFAVMRAKAKPIAKRSIPSVLGVVGEESLEKLREGNEWERLRYVALSGIRVECPACHGSSISGYTGPCRSLDHVEFPYLIELAVFDRKKDDQEGLRVYQCVNFMASMEDIFSRLYNINYHLGRVGISGNMPVTVVAHLVCPVLKWLNYGKSGLDE